MWVGCLATPRWLFPRERDSVPILQGVGGFEGRHRPARNEPRTARLVASHYTDHANPAQSFLVIELNACLIS